MSPTTPKARAGAGAKPSAKSRPARVARPRGLSPIGGLPPDLDTYSGSPLTWRWNYIAGLDAPWARHAAYFCALDEATDAAAVAAHPEIPPAERRQRLADMGKVAALLIERIRARASGKSGGAPFAKKSPRLTELRPAVKKWSKLQLALLRGYYPAARHGMDLQAIDEAYLMFVSGEMRVPLVGRRGIGEADSAYYFAFAEFALLAIDLSIDAADWAKLLPTLVWTQPIYCDMQRPIGPGPYSFHDYIPRGRERIFRCAMLISAQAKRAAAKTLDDWRAAHARNCRDAFA